MTYDSIKCIICNKDISNGGAAFTAHMRAHVRRNEAVEHKRNGKLLFMKVGEDITINEPYPRLGKSFKPNDPLPGQIKGVWELPDLKVELPAIDPSSYFITSGEAVKKADKLMKDTYALFIKCRQFRDAMKKIRGDNEYLEMTHEDRRIVVRIKNRRVKATELENDPQT